MEKKESSVWNEKSKTGSYSRPVHHREMIAGSKITNLGTDESLQDLSNKQGMNLANKIMEKLTAEEMLKDFWKLDKRNEPFDEMYVGHLTAIITAMKAYALQEVTKHLEIAANKVSINIGFAGMKLRVQRTIIETKIELT